MFVYTVVDSSKCIALNVLRSTGRPTITVIVNTFVCVVVMLPVGYYWGVSCGFGLIGLWAGMSVAWLCATIIFCVIVIRTDWGDPSLALVHGESPAIEKKGTVAGHDIDASVKLETGLAAQ